jgi:hypothetical protein
VKHRSGPFQRGAQSSLSETLFLLGAALSLLTGSLFMGALWLTVGILLGAARLFSSRQ